MGKSAKNMAVLVQNQTTTKVGPFLIILPKVRLHTIFFGPFCVLRPKLRSLGNTDDDLLLYASKSTHRSKALMGFFVSLSSISCIL
jgi:hypothetical protein